MGNFNVRLFVSSRHLTRSSPRRRNDTRELSQFAAVQHFVWLKRITQLFSSTRCVSHHQQHGEIFLRRKRKKSPTARIYWCVVSNHNQLRRRRNRHNSCSHAIVSGEIKSTRLDIIMCIEWEWLILTLWNLSEHDYTHVELERKWR